MVRGTITVIAAALLVTAGDAQVDSTGIPLPAEPPSIVRTVPAAGDTVWADSLNGVGDNVDFSLDGRGIRIALSKPIRYVDGFALVEMQPDRADTLDWHAAHASFGDVVVLYRGLDSAPPLLPGRYYRVVLKGVRDVDGQRAAELSFGFFTAAADVHPPAIRDSRPAAGAVDVDPARLSDFTNHWRAQDPAAEAGIVIRLDEPVVLSYADTTSPLPDSSSVVVVLQDLDSGAVLPWDHWIQDGVLTLYRVHASQPALEPHRTYRVSIAGAADRAGNRADTLSITFATGTGTAAPTVTWIFPQPGSTVAAGALNDISLVRPDSTRLTGGGIGVRFSEPLASVARFRLWDLRGGHDGGLEWQVTHTGSEARFHRSHPTQPEVRSGGAYRLTFDAVLASGDTLTDHLDFHVQGRWRPLEGGGGMVAATVPGAGDTVDAARLDTISVQLQAPLLNRAYPTVFAVDAPPDTLRWEAETGPASRLRLFPATPADALRPGRTYRVWLPDLVMKAARSDADTDARTRLELHRDVAFSFSTADAAPTAALRADLDPLPGDQEARIAAVAAGSTIEIQILGADLPSVSGWRAELRAEPDLGLRVVEPGWLTSGWLPGARNPLQDVGSGSVTLGQSDGEATAGSGALGTVTVRLHGPATQGQIRMTDVGLQRPDGSWVDLDGETAIVLRSDPRDTDTARLDADPRDGDQGLLFAEQTRAADFAVQVHVSHPQSLRSWSGVLAFAADSLHFLGFEPGPHLSGDAAGFDEAPGGSASP